MSAHDRTTGTNPLVIWSVVLGVVIVGLGGWVVYDLFFTSGAPSGELAQLVDDYETAWEAADGDAFAALVTEDYTFEWGGTRSGVASMRAAIVGEEGFGVDTVSEVWSGEGPTYYAAMAQAITSAAGYPGPDGSEGVSVLTIVADGDGYLIARHVWFSPTN